MRADYAVVCDGPEYDRIWSFAVAAIAIYPVGIPLFYLVLLLYARDAIASEKPTPLSKALRFLHGEYKLAFFWWEEAEVRCCTIHWRLLPPVEASPYLSRIRLDSL